MNILNSNEAFAAMMAGRNIMCRAIGELIEFNDIDQFPANIFAKPGYEFCIKVESMELAGITFTKPLTLDDVVEGQEIFLVYPNHIAHTQFTSLSGKYVECVKNGFAQMDQENAELQLQAIGKLLGRTIAYPLTIESHYKPEKKRRSRKAEESTVKDQNSTSNDVEEKTFDEAIETDPDTLFEKFTKQIADCKTESTVLNVRSIFACNNNLSDRQIKDLCIQVENRLEQIDPEQYTPKVEPSNDLSVDELKRLQEEAESLIQSQKDEHLEQPVQSDVDDIHQVLLNELLGNVAKATTPTEVNAQIKYTKSWTEEQRKPLIDAINKRLVELNPPKAQSSLAVRIQKAEDLTELDALEIDVSACDEEIQPRLMEMVEKRRLELDPFTAAIGEP